MNFCALVATSTILVGALAFAPVSYHAFVSNQQPGTASASFLHSKVTVQNMADSDFASAMPVKPPLSILEQLEKSAIEFRDIIRSSLAEGVEEPPELAALEEAVTKGADMRTLATRIYELMIEQGMLYDKDPETGVLTPTEYDIPANLDVPEVKKEFSFLYTYGISLITKGMIPMDTVKEIVENRLISRTGLSPEEFDAWLGF